MRLAVIIATIYATTAMLPSQRNEFSSKSMHHHKGIINKCCIIHDKCYDAQRGQELCDKTFCSCLDVVTRGSETCHQDVSPLACEMVRQFGQEAYRQSGNKTLSKSTLIEEPQVISMYSLIDESDV
ncbi:hypothetical protein COOONC_15238 [Cooperia oncophora]